VSAYAFLLGDTSTLLKTAWWAFILLAGAVFIVGGIYGLRGGARGGALVFLVMGLVPFVVLAATLFLGC
jgi:hypothetical protein